MHELCLGNMEKKARCVSQKKVNKHEKMTKR
jgi:hypothetical protein